MANEVRVLITANDEASAKIKDVGDTAANTEGPLRKMAGGLGDVAKIAGGFVVAQGFFQLGGFLKGSIGSASDMAEAQSKVNVVFGEGAGEINAFASTAAKSLGISKGAALDATGTFGNLFTALGLSGDASVGMSKDVVSLAADLGSFNNLGTDEVLDKLRAGLVGEAEPLRALGININAAAVEAKAMEMGLVDVNGEVTEAGKVQARMALILEQSTAAQGDFARTSGGAANQQKILKAQLADVSAQIGTALLPAVVKIGQVLLNDVIPKVQEFGNAVGPLIAKGFEYVQTEVIPRIKAGFEFFKTDILPKIREFAAEAREKLAEFGAFIQTEFAKFQVYYEEDIKPAMENIKTAVEKVIAFIRDHWPEIETIVRPVIEQVQNIIETAVGIVMGVLDILIQLLGGDFKGAWEATKELIGTVKDFWVETIQNGYDLIKGILGLLWELGKQAMTDLRDGIASMVGSLLDYLGSIPGRALDALGDLSSYLFQKGKDFVQGFVNGMFSVSIPSVLDLASGMNPGTKIGNKIGGALGLRANGGPVMAGSSYIVGERGPELFTPGSSGMITPNHAMGGDININGAVTVIASSREEAMASLGNVGYALRTLQARGLA